METKPFSYQFYKTTATALDAMYQALQAAQKSIYWELYILEDDKAGNRFIDILCLKACHGLKVKIILDSIGSFTLSTLSLARLKGAGVDVQWYNHLRLEWRLSRWLGRVWRRNHRKVLIIDEETAFIGGVNVSAKFFDWDDLHLKLTGRVIHPLLHSFAKAYLRSGGSRHAIKHLLHPSIMLNWKEWRDKYRFILNSPSLQGYSAIRRLYLGSLTMAKETFNLLTPYYVPDPQFLKLVHVARKRGVKINIFLPFQTDYRILQWIARAYFELTNRAGGNIYLLPKMNHGKGMTVDKTSGFVGSANFTPRSFFNNEEAGFLFNDEQMVQDLNTIFAQLKDNAEPLNAASWKKRGWRSKIKEWWAKRLEDYV